MMQDRGIEEKRIQWQKESAELKEYEKKYEAKLARRRVIGWVLLAAVLLSIVLIVTITLVRFYRYNMAEARLIVGDYKKSAEAFMEMADYRNSREMVYESAVGLYRQKMYEEALPYFVWLDGYMDNGFHLKKCREYLNIIPVQ